MACLSTQHVGRLIPIHQREQSYAVGAGDPSWRFREADVGDLYVFRGNDHH